MHSSRGPGPADRRPARREQGEGGAFYTMCPPKTFNCLYILEPKTSCAARLPMLCPAPTAALRIPRAVPTRHRPLRPPHPALGSRTPGHCTQNSTPTTAEDAAQHRTHCSAPAREPHEHARAAPRRRITQHPPDPRRTAADPNSTRAKPPQRRPAPRAPTVQVCPKSRATFPKLSTCPTRCRDLHVLQVSAARSTTTTCLTTWSPPRGLS